MSIVGLIATYRGERLLGDAVRSLRPFVDQVIVLDGAYAGIDNAGLPTWSTTLEHLEAVTAGALWFDAPTAWPGEIEKRNALLELGRAFVPEDGNRWALVLDEDEVLVHGHRLRPFIADLGADGDEGAPGLPRVEPNGDVYLAPSRLFRLTDSVRYDRRSYWLYDAEAPSRMIDLSHWREDPEDATPSLVHIVHRWDERSPARAHVQQLWGRELARLDGHG